jgi:fatty acid desaturase
MSEALEVQVRPIPVMPRVRRKVAEWPTLVVTIGCYGFWLLLTWSFHAVPLWVSLPLGSVLLTLHSSLQHEVLHGHPTSSKRLNRLFGIVPLSMWIPYERYRQTHLLHHIDDRLTDPLDDPESTYWTAADWQALAPWQRWLVKAQTTLLGRVVIGPFWSIARFWRDEARRVIRNDLWARRVWAEHLAWCGIVIVWVSVICEIPLWLYILGMVIPGTSLLLIRSFAEHKALPEARERTAIVENSWILGPLFLFNNLHVLHHDEPMIPWYQYPAHYRANRDRYVQENGGLVYDGYLDVCRRFLLRSHDRPRHPTDRVPRGA